MSGAHPLAGPGGRTGRAGTGGRTGVPGTGGPARRAGRGQRGSGAVLTLGLVCVLLAALVAVTVLGRAVEARGVARTAADLGALAGASALHGTVPGDPCVAASRIVRAQGAQPAGCVIEGETVLVTAATTVDLGYLGARRATATARAGPAG